MLGKYEFFLNNLKYRVTGYGFVTKLLQYALRQNQINSNYKYLIKFARDITMISLLRFHCFDFFLCGLIQARRRRFAPLVLIYAF